MLITIFFKFCDTTFLFTNAHLGAHQDRASERNDDYARIDGEMPVLLHAKGLRRQEKRKPSMTIAQHLQETQDESGEEKKDQDNSESKISSEGAPLQRRSIHESNYKQLLDCADRIIFMGDLNYRSQTSISSCV